MSVNSERSAMRLSISLYGGSGVPYLTTKMYAGGFPMTMRRSYLERMGCGFLKEGRNGVCSSLAPPRRRSCLCVRGGASSALDWLVSITRYDESQAGNRRLPRGSCRRVIQRLGRPSSCNADVAGPLLARDGVRVGGCLVCRSGLSAAGIVFHESGWKGEVRGVRGRAGVHHCLVTD